MAYNQADRRFALRLGAIALAALALRLGLRLVVGVESYWIDGYTLYANLAQGIAEGHGYGFPGGLPTASRVPLYPLFIAGISGGPGNAWLLITAMAILSACTAVLAGLIARRLGGDAAGLLAAALLAAWPYSAWHDVSLQETGLLAFLAALASWLLLALCERREIGLALASGAVLGLAILTRAALAPFAACALVWLLLADARKTRWAGRITSAALAFAAMMLVLSPWLTHVRNVTGRYDLATESGYLLFVGNHPLTFSVYPEGSIDRSRDAIFAAEGPREQAELERLGSDEAATSHWFRARALQAIGADPAAFPARAAGKLWAAFGPLPSPRHGTLANLAYAAGWVPFFGLALAGMWLRRRRWREDGLLYLHFATFSAVTAVFWAHTAHRSYLDAYVAVFAAVAIAAMLPSRIKAALS